MSDYDRFVNWVEKQRRCPKDALETTINQIDIKFVRSIMKGIDQSKGTPATAKKTDTEKAKAFLLKCYMTAAMSLNVLDESSSYNFADLSAEETKKLLTKSIQLNMRQLRATDVLASKHVMLIARSLMKLLETFGDGHKGRFLDYVNNRLGISKSSYYYYMEYYAFMSMYPKFQNLAVSFRVFRSMIPKLKEWFLSEECRALDNSDFYSEQYWVDVDDVEMDEDDMDVVSNEPNSTAVENSSFQLLTPSNSSDDETVTFHRGGMSCQPSNQRQLMTPSDSSDDDVAANGRGVDIATFFQRGGKAQAHVNHVHRGGKRL